MKYLSFLLLAFVFACTQANDPTTAKNEATIRTAYDLLNQRNWDGFAALCTEDFTDLNVGPAPTVGIQNCLGLYQQFETAFPDFKITINEIAPVSSTRFLLRVTLTGTNTGSFMGLPATGKSIRFDDADVVEFNAEGKCISHAITNTGEPLRQIGYGSMNNPNTTTVMSVYEKFGKGDIESVLAMCDDKVVFDSEDRVFDSKSRVFNGKAEVGGFFKELGSKFKYAKFQPTRFVSDGEDVFTLVDVEYAHVPSGKNYKSTYTHHFKVANGKVTFFRGIDDYQQEQTIAGK
jgi:steroid delta-isomerase-like uncharacterized protein